MFVLFKNSSKLLRACITLAHYDALLSPDQLANLPAVARFALRAAAFSSRRNSRGTGGGLAAALTSLGPSYIKLGQFLATRPDLVGYERSSELKVLQDRLPPFAMSEARSAIAFDLGGTVEDHFIELGPPIAAASIAQVHRARTREGRETAVKILRPRIERRFAGDLASFFFAARLIERFSAEGRRLRPVAAVSTLENSMKLELDLRMEASAISELAENCKNDTGFRIPAVDWQRTGRQILTTEWIDGIGLSDVEALRANGVDLESLSTKIVQSFLRHAIRDGFFHADMHQGNLFVDRQGQLVAVDFGIMGRLGEKERLFFAEILYGFITRDYVRVANVHFDAGYVPNTEDRLSFAQALRAIGEPIMDKSASDISMARLLTQLFEVTAQFNMQTQPQLLLLQKTMVVTEGVARSLNPGFNMWVAAEPVIREWIERKLGPMGRLEDAVLSAGQIASSVPSMLQDAQKATALLADMARSGGLRLDEDTAAELARATSGQTRLTRLALVAGALALVVIAINLAF